MQHIEKAASGQMVTMIELFLCKLLEGTDFAELCKTYVPRLCEVENLDCEVLSALQVARQLVCHCKAKEEATFDPLLKSLELGQRDPVLRVFYSSSGHGKEVLESLTIANMQLQTQFTKALKMATQKEIVTTMDTSGDLKNFANAVISSVQLGIEAADLQTQSMDIDVLNITKKVLETCTLTIEKCKVQEAFQCLGDASENFMAEEVKVFFDSPEVKNVETMKCLLQMEQVMAMLSLHQANEAAKQLRAIEDISLFAPWQA